MRISFKDGGTMDSEIVELTQEGKTKYQDDNEHGEYYILESNGNLGMYGNDGKFDEAVKIKYNTVANNAYSLWRVKGCHQGFRSVTSFGFGGHESVSKLPQAICKTLAEITNVTAKFKKL